MATTTYKQRLVDGWADQLLEQLPALFVTGPRAAGKTTTFARRAKTIIRLDREADAAAFRADPDVALRGLAEPVLLDEWQMVPGVLGAARRAVEERPSPARFFVTGSVSAELDNEVWPGTGRLTRLKMYPMAVREQIGNVGAPTFFDRIAAGDELSVPSDTPDLLGYIELALKGGFPAPALTLSGPPRDQWLESYIEDLLTHDIEQLEAPKTKKRDGLALRRYFEAYALNSAGVVEHKRIFDAAQINKATASSYEKLLSDLLIIEQLPAWASNRFKRLLRMPKRYVIDPSLIAARLRLDAQGILRDSDLLGRIVDTFVVAQLRPEAAVSRSRPRLHHLRTEGGRHEIDLLAELAGEKIIGFEIKAGSAPDKGDAKHLAWLRDRLDDRFLAGVVFHTGPRAYGLGDRLTAVPISAIWG